MRIAYLNVWGETASETHTGETLKIVAKRLGVDIVPCRSSEDIDACHPDFVIVMSRTQAKLTRYPTYVCVNEPSTVYFREPKLLHYFYSFDGYLALADSLTQFTQHALQGIGRHEAVGVYYNSAHFQEADSLPVKDTLQSGKAKLTYFGTNWDGRRFSFFRQLGAWDGAEIYGPETNWRQFNIPAYKGEAPFDGVSPQNIYRRNGIGLNILGDHHLHEDVVSNRVFEIVSVGAVAVSCRMPWLEKHFGDTLYYIDQESTNARLLEQVQERVAHILAHPDEAFEKAQGARRIFEEKFSLDKMVANAIAYHKRHVVAHDHKVDPLVTVFIKSAGASMERLERALQSIAAQEKGRFQILLLAPKGFKPPPFSSPFARVEVVESASYWDAFARMEGEYAAFLRVDHEWFPQHVSRQLGMLEEGTFLHSALVEKHDAPVQETAWIGNGEKRGIIKQLDVQDRDSRGALDLICFSGLFVSAKMIKTVAQSTPPLPCLEEKDIILSLMTSARARQTFSATVLLSKADEMKEAPLTALEWSWLALRHWRAGLHTDSANHLWDQMVDSGVRARAYRFETLRREEDGVQIDELKYSRFDREHLKPIALPWLKDKSFFRFGLNLADETGMAIAMQSGDGMQGVAGFIAFPGVDDFSIPQEYLLVLEAEVEKGQFAIQLLTNARTLERYNVARAFPAGKRYRYEIPIYYRPEINGLVIEVAANTNARITAIKAYAE
jgi:hypothetical protein